QPQPAPPPFAHGVASGDPISNSVVLWTRITAPEAEATVRWEISSTPDFHTIVATRVVTTDSSRDYTIHVDPFSLQPATVYFYRVIVTIGSYSGPVSPTGRTKTAPAPGTPVDQWTLAVGSCA